MQENETKDTKKAIIFQVLLVFAIIGGYFLIDFNAAYNYLRGEGQYITQDTNCDLKKSACEVTIEDGTKISFEILPKEIPLMKPLTFRVKSDNQHLDDLSVRLYATNMLMGEYVLPLKHKGNGIYEAIGTLPTCPVGFMKWNADVAVGKINKVIGARFKFETDI